MTGFTPVDSNSRIARGSAALTGSLARGEPGTIARDLEGLRGDPFREVYRTIADALTHREVAQ